MRTIGLVLLLCVALAGCGGVAATPTPAATVAPTRSATLSAQRVIDGIGASGSVRLDTLGHTVARGTGNTEEITMLVFVGPPASNVVASGYIVAAPAGADLAALRADRLTGLPSGTLVAQDRNALLFLGFTQAGDHEADRATVEAALRAIP